MRRLLEFCNACLIAFPLMLYPLMLAGCGSSIHNSSNSGPGGGGTGGGGGGTGGGGTGGGGTGGGGGGTGGGGGGTGGGGGGTGGGTGASAQAEYLYAIAYEQQGSVFEFKIDPGTGVFTAMAGSQFKADVGTQPYVCTNQCFASLLADPKGRFLYYQYNYAGSGLDSLGVNPQDGTLSNIDRNSNVAYELAADPQGRFLYWNAGSSQGNSVDAYDISSNGGLNLAPGQPYPYSGNGSYGAPAVTANYLFAVSYSVTTPGALVEMAIDQGTGALAVTGNSAPIEAGGNPAVMPNGKFVYVDQMYMNNGRGEQEIVPVQVNSTGALNVLTPDAVQTTQNGPPYLWMSPNGNFVYAEVNGQLWDMQINQTTGALTVVQKYDIDTPMLAIDPAVKYVFVNQGTVGSAPPNTLTAYAVNATTGQLTAIPNSTVTLPAQPIGVAVVSPQPSQ